MSTEPSIPSNSEQVNKNNQKVRSKKLLKSFIEDSEPGSSTPQKRRREGHTERVIRDLWENLKKQMVSNKLSDIVKLGDTTKRYVKGFMEQLQQKDTDAPQTNGTLDTSEESGQQTDEEKYSSKIVLSEEEENKLKQLQNLQKFK